MFCPNILFGSKESMRQWISMDIKDNPHHVYPGAQTQVLGHEGESLHQFSIRFEAENLPERNNPPAVYPLAWDRLLGCCQPLSLVPVVTGRPCHLPLCHSHPLLEKLLGFSHSLTPCLRTGHRALVSPPSHPHLLWLDSPGLFVSILGLWLSLWLSFAFPW